MKLYILALSFVMIITTGCFNTSLSGFESEPMSNNVKPLPTNSQVEVDGENVAFEAYNINGNNYFKLRDIAIVLKGSVKEFEVQWDANKKEVNILTGGTYTPVGGELSHSANDGYAVSISSGQKILIDGVSAGIKSYNIDGYNYFKLRDLGSTLDFGVSWNSSLNLISIDTQVKYSEQPVEITFGKKAYAYIEYIQNNLSNRISGTPSEKVTAEYIEQELSMAGYTPDQLKVQNFEYSQNVIAEKKGINPKVIVVGAHYDSADTHGVDDNGSGVAVVLETAIKVLEEEMPYTIQFVFFGAEEPGKFGAQHYLTSLTSEEKENILFLINIDSILAGDKQYIFGGQYHDGGNVTDTWVAERAHKLAGNLGLETYMMFDVNHDARTPSNYSDHIYFRDLGIPYVFFWAGNLDLDFLDTLNQTEKLGKIMHTPNDDLSVLNNVFKGRAQERLSNYSLLLYYMLKDDYPAL